MLNVIYKVHLPHGRRICGTFTDHFTKFCYVYLFSKNEALAKFKNYKTASIRNKSRES